MAKEIKPLEFGVFCLSDIVLDGPTPDSFFSHLDETDSQRPGALVYCQNLHYFQRALENPNVTAIIATRDLAAEPIVLSKQVIIADDPRLAFFTLYAGMQARGLNRPEMTFGVGTGCRIHPSAVVSSRTRIGNRVEIAPGAVIEDYVQIGDDVYIGPNAAIGAEGLATLRRADGSLLRVKHAGSVTIGDGVEILAGAVVAKSLFRMPTTIGDHCQIGILANVGHGASIGAQSVVSGNSIIAGRTRIGARVRIGASSSVAQGLTVGDGAQIKMGSVVVSNILPNSVVSGNFAVDHRTTMKRFLRSDS